MMDKMRWIEIVLMPLAIALVGTIGTYFITSQQQENAETKAATDRQVKLLDIFAEKIASSDESERIFALRLLGAVDHDLAGKLAEAVSETSQEKTKIKEVADDVAKEALARANSLPRIYLHIQDEKERTAAQQVGAQLNENGYATPGIARLVNFGPSSSQLRYFRKSEEPEARKIVKILLSIGVNVTLQYISGYENSAVIRPQHYELWFSVFSERAQKHLRP